MPRLVASRTSDRLLGNADAGEYSAKLAVYLVALIQKVADMRRVDFHLCLHHCFDYPGCYLRDDCVTRAFEGGISPAARSSQSVG